MPRIMSAVAFFLREDSKFRKRIFGAGLHQFNLFDGRKWRPSAQFLLEMCQGWRCPLCYHLNTPIGQVSDVADQVMALCSELREEPVSHALHLAVNAEPSFVALTHGVLGSYCGPTRCVFIFTPQISWTQQMNRMLPSLPPKQQLAQPMGIWSSSLPCLDHICRPTRGEPIVV
jgi:hypothetical protein